MCNIAVIEFFIDNIKPEEFKGKRVIEVGSKYVNGSVRPLIENFCSPREYNLLKHILKLNHQLL